MALDRLQNSGLTRAFTDLFADVGNLLHREMKLAQAEVTEKITSRLRASIWMVAAGLLALIVVLLVVEAAVFAIASAGLALHWACLVVAGVLAAAAIATFFYGRSLAEDDLMPKRSARHINQDIRTAKEQLT